MCNLKDFELILSNNVFINKNYINKELLTIASDTKDDGTILYKMNEHGYRSNSFKNKSEFNVLTLGCSWTMGVGVRNEAIWPQLISEQIENKIQKKVTLFNYGTYGVSTPRRRTRSLTLILNPRSISMSIVSPSTTFKTLQL